MNRKIMISLAFLCLTGTTLFFSCGMPISLNSTKSNQLGTGVGNPFAANQLLAALCGKIIQGHQGLTSAMCDTGLGYTSLGFALGLPVKNGVDPFQFVLAADQAGTLVGDPQALGRCLKDIAALDPASSAVQYAYIPTDHDPFCQAYMMIPQIPGNCPAVYAAFSNIGPSPTPAPTPGVTVADFDNPVPAGTPPYYMYMTTYQGIVFGSGQWAWQGPYAADQSNSIFFATANYFGGGSFQLPQGSTLLSIDVFTTTTGQISIYDSGGSSSFNLTVYLNVPADGAVHRVNTGWTLPSNGPITVNFYSPGAPGWNLGVDNIQYK